MPITGQIGRSNRVGLFFGAAAAPPSYLEVTNAQKLALTGVSVGQVVHVTDAFVVSGTGDERDGLYVKSGDDYVRNDPRHTGEGFSFELIDANHWGLQRSFEGDSLDASLGTETYPWEANWSGAGITLTHPAVQTLAAPSTAQGGVFVSGGTQDGIYAIDSANSPYNGRSRFLLLGAAGGDNSHFEWATDLNDHWGLTPISAGWVLADSDNGAFYYSLSDVATPDLASNWKNASDDSPASITVTSVTQGELDAGAQQGSSVFLISGDLLGRRIYLLLGGDPDYDTPQWTGENWSNPNVGDAIGNTAFPWAADWSPAPTVTRNDIAAEANWHVVP